MTNDIAETVGKRALGEADSHLKEVLDQLPKAAAKKPKKRKYVHELRVESRRAEAALGLYGDFLPQRRRKRILKQLKKIRRAAGKARDLDVFIETLEKDKTAQNSGALLKIARSYRDEAQEDMIAAGRAAKRAGLRSAVRKFLKDAKKRHANGSIGFAPWARTELRPAVRAFFDAVPPVEPGLRQLHAFRIQAKNLRYRMEMLESAFPAAFKNLLLPRVESLQERLGELNDIATRRRRLEKWLKRTKDTVAAHHLREHIALDTSRLAQARADFAAWCTPAFLQHLRQDFDSVLTGLTLVVPAGTRAGGG